MCLKYIGRSGRALAPNAEVDSWARTIAEEGDEEETDNGDYEDIDTEDEKEDGDNQVVPWTSSLSGPAASRSSEEESFRRGGHYGYASIGVETPISFSMERRRDGGDFLHQET